MAETHAIKAPNHVIKDSLLRRLHKTWLRRSLVTSAVPLGIWVVLINAENALSNAAGVTPDDDGDEVDCRLRDVVAVVTALTHYVWRVLRDTMSDTDAGGGHYSSSLVNVKVNYTTALS